MSMPMDSETVVAQLERVNAPIYKTRTHVVWGSPPNDPSDGATATLPHSSSPSVVHEFPPDSQTGRTDRTDRTDGSINAESPLIQKGYATAAAVANNSTEFQETSSHIPSTKSNDEPRLLVRLEKLPKTKQRDRTTKPLTTSAEKDNTTENTMQADGQHHVNIQGRLSHRPSKQIAEPVTQHNRPQGKVQDRTDRHPAVQLENSMATSTKVPRWTAHRSPAVHNEHHTERHRDIQRQHNPQHHVISQNTSVQHPNKSIAKAVSYVLLKKFQRARNSGKANANHRNTSVHNDHRAAGNKDIQGQSNTQHHQNPIVENDRPIASKMDIQRQTYRQLHVASEDPRKPIEDAAEVNPPRRFPPSPPNGMALKESNTSLRNDNLTERNRDIQSQSKLQQHGISESKSLKHPSKPITEATPAGKRIKLQGTQHSGRSKMEPQKQHQTVRESDHQQHYQDCYIPHPIKYQQSILPSTQDNGRTLKDSSPTLQNDNFQKKPNNQNNKRTTTDWNSPVQGNQRERRMEAPNQSNQQQNYQESSSRIPIAQDRGRTITDWNPSEQQEHSTKIPRQFDQQQHDNLAPDNEQSKIPTANHSDLTLKPSDPSVQNDRPIERYMDIESQVSENPKKSIDDAAEDIPPRRFPPFHTRRMALRDSNPSEQNDNLPKKPIDEGETPVQRKQLPKAQYSGRTITDWNPSVQGDRRERRMEVSRQSDQLQHYQESSFRNPIDSLPHGRLPIAQDRGRSTTDWNPSIQQEHSDNQHIKIPTGKHSDLKLKPSNPLVENDRPKERYMDIESQNNRQHHAVSEDSRKSINDAVVDVPPSTFKDSNRSLQTDNLPKKPIDEDELPVQRKQLPKAQYSARAITDWNPSVQGDRMARRMEVSRQSDQQRYYPEASFHQQNKFPTRDSDRRLKDSLQNESPTEININMEDQSDFQDSSFQHSRKPIVEAGLPVQQNRHPIAEYNDGTRKVWKPSVRHEPSEDIVRKFDHQKHYQEDTPTQDSDRTSKDWNQSVQIDNPIERNQNSQDQPILQSLKFSQDNPSDKLEPIKLMKTLSVRQHLTEATQPLEYQSEHYMKGITYRFPYDGPPAHKMSHGATKTVDEEDLTTTEPSEEPSSDDTTMRKNKSAKRGKKGRKSRRKGNGKNRKRRTKKQRSEAAKKRKRVTTTTENNEEDARTTEPDEE